LRSFKEIGGVSSKYEEFQGNSISFENILGVSRKFEEF